MCVRDKSTTHTDRHTQTCRVIPCTRTRHMCTRCKHMCTRCKHMCTRMYTRCNHICTRVCTRIHHSLTHASKRDALTSCMYTILVVCTPSCAYNTTCLYLYPPICIYMHVYMHIGYQSPNITHSLLHAQAHTRRISSLHLRPHVLPACLVSVCE